MENLDFPPEAFLAFENFDQQRQFYLQSQTWPLPTDQMSHNGQPSTNPPRANTTSAGSSQPLSSTAPVQTTGLGYHHGMDPSAALLTSSWQYQLQQQHAQSYLQDASIDHTPFTPASYGFALQTSPTDFKVGDFSMPTSQGLNTSLPMDNTATSYMPLESMQAMQGFQMADFQQELMNYPIEGQLTSQAEFVPSSLGGSPTGELLEIRSLSSSDNGWIDVYNAGQRNSLDGFHDANATVFNPMATLHIRTNSNESHHSDIPQSAHSHHSFSSYEEIPFPMHSPQSEGSLELVHTHSHAHSHSHSHSHIPHGLALPHDHSPTQSHVSPSAVVEPMPINQSSSSSSTSPSSSGIRSPPSRRRKSPTGLGSKVEKTIAKKTPAPHSTKKDAVAEKRVGRRRGPLRPDQRQQAHEIRKLRACLRCKFLKKTCDKGDPCGGCQPSHARLWQVPCTRIDIKDIAYFMKDWKADYERHVSLGFSVNNIKGYSTMERQIYITHGYGFYLPINAREVYVREDKCFGVDWVETCHESPKQFECNTAKLCAGIEGVSHKVLSEYLDRHVDSGFEKFVDEYFEGTFFLTEILKTAYRYYLREKLPVIRKALKLVVAYNLTLHVTMIEGLSDEEAQQGKIDNPESKFCGHTVAPVMINFQVKCALSDMWRELQKDILEELSALYSSVYSGEKLKNWPTIFMLAAILLGTYQIVLSLFN